MPHITSNLGNEPGIQYNRPNDKTGGFGIAPINNVILGSFKRGRTDQLMNITKQNIRAVLGFDPTNPFYVAVQDALDTNVPSVKVLRVIANKEIELPIISCDGATDRMYFPEFFGTWELYIDEVFQIEHKVQGVVNHINSVFNGILLAEATEWREEGEGGWWSIFDIRNLSTHAYRIKLIPVYDEIIRLPEVIENPTFSQHEDGSLTFCLAAAQIIEPDYPYYAQVLLDRDPAYTVPPNAYMIKDFKTGQEFIPNDIMLSDPLTALYGFEMGALNDGSSVIRTRFCVVNHTDETRLLGIKVDPVHQNYLINGLSDQLTYDASDNYWKGYLQPFPLDELSVEVVGVRLNGNIAVIGKADAPREKIPFTFMQLWMDYTNGIGQQSSSAAYMNGSNYEQYINSETGVFQIKADYRNVANNPFDVALRWGPLAPRAIHHNETISYTLDHWTIKTIINGQTEYPTVLATIRDLPALFASLYTHIGYALGASTTVDYEVSELVQSLGDSAFANVPQCASITFFNPVPVPIGNNVFDNTNNCPIYVPAASLNTYKTAPGWSTYANRIFAIEEEQWDIEYVLNGETIREVTGNPIPNSYANNATGLKAGNFNSAESLTINDSVSQINASAFNHWYTATSLHLPSTILSIQSRAFYNWAALTSIVIPNSVVSIGESAFYNCSNATTLTLGTSVSMIESLAFRTCMSLESIIIHKLTPPTLQNNAFPDNGCPIYVPLIMLDHYKNSPGWNVYANRIFAIPS